jgi:signal transduction histidine kinase
VEVLAADEVPSTSAIGRSRLHGVSWEQVERDEIIRIAREAMVNAARHGGARHITVQLGSREDDLILRVSDDGRGISPRTSPRSPGSGFGLPAMGARARALGGELIARSPSNGGAQIDVVSRRLAS